LNDDVQLSKRVLEMEESKGVRICRGANVHEEKMRIKLELRRFSVFTNLAWLPEQLNLCLVVVPEAENFSARLDRNFLSPTHIHATSQPGC
jgi:hypothetical protein